MVEFSPTIVACPWLQFPPSDTQGIEQGVFHKGVTKMLVSLICKEGNQRILLIGGQLSTHNISTKFPLRPCNYIFNHYLVTLFSHGTLFFYLSNSLLIIFYLTQESLHWAKSSKQPIVFLNLISQWPMTKFHGLFFSCNALDKN